MLFAFFVFPILGLAATVPNALSARALEARDISATGDCGTNGLSCPAGSCCSKWNYWYVAVSLSIDKKPFYVYTYSLPSMLIDPSSASFLANQIFVIFNSGFTSDHCDAGCQNNFGRCNQSNPGPGSCGGPSGAKCPGSLCCSQWGYWYVTSFLLSSYKSKPFLMLLTFATSYPLDIDP